MGQQSLGEWSTESDGSRPKRCLSFTIRGPWGHFRRIEGNIVKQTYRIIPRTTVAGLLAAVVGIERGRLLRSVRPRGVSSRHRTGL